MGVDAGLCCIIVCSRFPSSSAGVAVGKICDWFLFSKNLLKGLYYILVSVYQENFIANIYDIYISSMEVELCNVAMLKYNITYIYNII